MGKLTKLMFILVLGAGMIMASTSCKREEPVVETPVDETPVATGLSKVSVTAGAGIVQTKSAVVMSGTTRNLTFTSGDRLYVRGEITGTVPQKIVAGYLDMDGTPDTDGTGATFSGDLEVFEYNQSAGRYDASSFEFTDASDPFADCTSIKGTLVHEDAEDFVVDELKDFYYTSPIAATVEELMTESLEVSGFYDNGIFSLCTENDESRCTPIFNCTLNGLPADATCSLYYYEVDDGLNYEKGCQIGEITTDGSGNANFACYVSGVATSNIYHCLQLNTDNGFMIANLGKKALVSKVYNINREVYPQSVDLSSVTQRDENDFLYYDAKGGQTISGTFNDVGYITIADGATVTLNIENLEASSDCCHAPIHCLGDAYLILADGMQGTASVESGPYPAVFVPEGKTLTISGTGELTADASGSYGAGIGGGYDYDSQTPINCGNIVIAGGVISAYSGEFGAGIGGALYGSCGNITVSGGIIKEAGPMNSTTNNSAGIGSGQHGSCGTITISGGQIGGDIDDVYYDGARAGDGSACIGCGTLGSCGTIRIGTGITYVGLTQKNNDFRFLGRADSDKCDVYFGDVKAFDKEGTRWYDGSGYTLDYPGSCGGITVVDTANNYLSLTPAAP